MEEKETSILPVAIILKTILDNARKGGMTLRKAVKIRSEILVCISHTEEQDTDECFEKISGIVKNFTTK